MQKFRVEIAPVVIEEIEETVLYIAKDSVIDAISWSFEIQKKIQSLEQFPARCPLAEESQLFDYDIHHLIVGLNILPLIQLHRDVRLDVF